MAGNFVSLEDVWTDYDGDSAYGDYSVTPGTPATVTNLRSYQPGMAVVDPWLSTGNSATDYFVTDHLGTTRGMTLPNGFPEEGATFTAFGEKITGADHRYGYVGAHGYQAHEDMAYLHLGARYYDPACGRFLQRDPIGIEGGGNVYEYTESRPITLIDPDGLFGCRRSRRCAYDPPNPAPEPTAPSTKIRIGVKNGVPYIDIYTEVEVPVDDPGFWKKAWDQFRRPFVIEGALWCSSPFPRKRSK